MVFTEVIPISWWCCFLTPVSWKVVVVLALIVGTYLLAFYTSDGVVLLVSIYLFEMVMSLPVRTYMRFRWVVVVVCYLSVSTCLRW